MTGKVQIELRRPMRNDRKYQIRPLPPRLGEDTRPNAAPDAGSVEVTVKVNRRRVSGQAAIVKDATAGQRTHVKPTARSAQKGAFAASGIRAPFSVTSTLRCVYCKKLFLSKRKLNSHLRMGAHGPPNLVSDAELLDGKGPVRTARGKDMSVQGKKRKGWKPDVRAASPRPRLATMCQRCGQVPPIPGDNVCYRCIK